MFRKIRDTRGWCPFSFFLSGVPCLRFASAPLAASATCFAARGPACGVGFASLGWHSVVGIIEKKSPPKGGFVRQNIRLMKIFIIELKFYDWNDDFVVKHVLEINAFVTPYCRVAEYVHRIQTYFSSCKTVEVVWKTR